MMNENIELVFVLPKDDGWEAPFGRNLQLIFPRHASIADVHEAVQKAVDRKRVRLSIERPSGNKMTLSRLDPDDGKSSVIDLANSAKRIVVGW